MSQRYEMVLQVEPETPEPKPQEPVCRRRPREHKKQLMPLSFGAHKRARRLFVGAEEEDDEEKAAKPVKKFDINDLFILLRKTD